MTLDGFSFQLKSLPVRVYFLLIGLGALLTGVNVYTLNLAHQWGAHYAVLVDACKEIRYESTDAQLRFEQMIFELTTTDGFEKIDQSRERCLALSRALLSGGAYRGERIAPLEDDELQGLLYEQLARLNRFFDALREQGDSWQHGAGVVSQPFATIARELHAELVEGVVRVEDRLKEVIGEQHQHFRLLQRLVQAASLLVLIAASVMLLLYIRSWIRQQRELAASEARFRSLIEHAQDGIFLVDAEEHRLIEANPALCEQLGWEHQALLYRHIAVIQPDFARLLASLDVLEDGEYSRLLETTFHRKSGGVIPVEVNMGRIRHNGSSCWLGMVRDLSERKRIEQHLIEAKCAAEEASHMKTLFLANMSHEVRTPLNGTMGMLQLLESSTLDPEQSECVETAIQSCRALTGLFNDILDLSRIESGDLKIELAPFDLNGLIDSIERVFGSLALKNGIYFKTSIQEGLPDLLIGDVTRIRQVVKNLVSNAVKFTRKGGVELMVSATVLTTAELELLIEVRDSGVGIAEAKMKSIFEAFSQEDVSFTRRYQGAGLGLSIVERLVRLMGGSVELESQEGVGTAVEVRLKLGIEGDASKPEKHLFAEDMMNRRKD